jgi:hypothetical protein
LAPWIMGLRVGFKFCTRLVGLLTLQVILSFDKDFEHYLWLGTIGLFFLIKHFLFSYEIFQLSA